MNWFDKKVLRHGGQGEPKKAVRPPVDSRSEITVQADIRVWEVGPDEWRWSVTVLGPGGKKKSASNDSYMYPSHNQKNATEEAERTAKLLADQIRVEIAPKVVTYSKEF